MDLNWEGAHIVVLEVPDSVKVVALHTCSGADGRAGALFQSGARLTRLGQNWVILPIVIVLFSCMVIPANSATSLKAIAARGSISYSPSIELIVNASNIIGTNKLSLGVQLSYGSLGFFQTSPQLRQLAKDANIKLVRIFDILTSNKIWIPTLMPCIRFNETVGTGKYNWTNVDGIVGKILEIGATPLVCLGAFDAQLPMIPLGMGILPSTGLPNPQSYASYAAEWARHFRLKGWDVKFYQIFNEPWSYFGWEPVNYSKLDNYIRVFNAAAAAMRQENADLVISFDFIGRKPVMDYWLTHAGAEVDSIDFHKYDAWVVGQTTDAEMFTKADSDYFETWPLGRSVVEARQTWFDSRGRNLPMICSESNFNAAYENGTDLRIQQMTGAVWLAMVLRNEILVGVSYHTYFELSSSFNQNSYGFGMIYNVANGFKPWYPYYVYQMLGNSLIPGDQIVEIECSSEDMRTVSWNHNGKLNMLLICKNEGSRTVNIRGCQNQQLRLTRIDNTIPYQNAQIQTGIISSTEPLVINGYTVVLLQAT